VLLRKEKNITQKIDNRTVSRVQPVKLFSCFHNQPFGQIRLTFHVRKDTLEFFLELGPWDCCVSPGFEKTTQFEEDGR